jgi:hypothetical protein
MVAKLNVSNINPALRGSTIGDMSSDCSLRRTPETHQCVEPIDAECSIYQPRAIRHVVSPVHVARCATSGTVLAPIPIATTICRSLLLNWRLPEPSLGQITNRSSGGGATSFKRTRLPDCNCIGANRVPLQIPAARSTARPSIWPKMLYLFVCSIRKKSRVKNAISGGGGNRTRVRESVWIGVYVCFQWFIVGASGGHW